MSYICFNVRLDCWPVGQGLFMSGKLEGEKLEAEKIPAFHWVYDCGATKSSKSSELKKSIFGYNKNINPSDIDLLVISHFDNDHISGIVELCKKRKIGRVLLPYMSPWTRICLAIADLETRGEDITPDKIKTSFAYNPILAVKNNIPGAEILVVLGEGEEESYRDDPIYAEYEIYESVNLVQDPAGGKVSILKSKVPLHLDKIWEFMPYNDNIIVREWLTKCIKAFLGSNAESFKHCPDDKNLDLIAMIYHKYKTQDKEDREPILKRLLETPEDKIPKSVNFENIISLFLYCGPIGEYAHKAVSVEDYDTKRPKLRKEFHWLDNRRNAQLYTGDGYLDNVTRWDKLCKAYGRERIGKISFLQVMHHGSKNNWYSGLANEIEPQISMFSSDPAVKFGPKKTSHPDKEVWDDFSTYNPVQVGGGAGCHLTVSWRFCSNWHYHRGWKYPCGWPFFSHRDEFLCPICGEAW